MPADLDEMHAGGGFTNSYKRRKCHNFKAALGTLTTVSQAEGGAPSEPPGKVPALRSG